MALSGEYDPNAYATKEKTIGSQLLGWQDTKVEEPKGLHAEIDEKLERIEAKLDYILSLCPQPTLIKLPTDVTIEELERARDFLKDPKNWEMPIITSGDVSIQRVMPSFFKTPEPVDGDE